jgi:hypothetical protein
VKGSKEIVKDSEDAGRKNAGKGQVKKCFLLSSNTVVLSTGTVCIVHRREQEGKDR